jgi:hypothetical protein
MLVSSLRSTLGTMSSFWKVGTTAAVLAVLGAFFLGRVIAEQAPLPDVGDPVTVGSTASPTPSAEAPRLRPRGDRSPEDRRTERPTSDATFDDDDDDGGKGRGRGRGRGGDDDEIEEIGPSPSEIEDDDDDDFDDDDFDDHGGDDDNSGPGSDDSGSGSDDD